MVAPGGASEKRSFDLFRLPRLIHNPAPWRKLPPSELPCKPNCRFSPSHAKLPILHRTLPTGLATLTVQSHLTSQSQQRVCSSNSLIVASRSENCLPATHPTAPPLVLQRHMIFTCAAKHLCGAPPGMPVPPHCNHPEKPQHSCAICAESMHSAAPNLPTTYLLMIPTYNHVGLVQLALLLEVSSCYRYVDTTDMLTD